jgi:membrane fusion protein (multidrug efflux system)
MKKWLMVLVPLLVLAALIAWRFGQKNAEGADQAGQRGGRMRGAATVELSTVGLRDIRKTFQATGNVESMQNVKISPRLTGRIEYLQVREGDRVKQGQVLVRIAGSTTRPPPSASAQADLRLAEQSYAAQLAASSATVEDAQGKIESSGATVSNAQSGINSAQANLDNATAKYNRTTELHSKGFVSAQEVDNARTAVSMQQAAVETAKGQLKAAQAAQSSAQAQKKSAEQQAVIAKMKADAGVDSARARVEQANTALASALAQQRSAEQQTAITRAKADADLESARARIEQAGAALENARASTQSPAFRQSLEALKAGIDAARASLDSAQAKLNDTELRSPLDGVITARTQDPGTLASPGQPILTIQSLNHIWVTIAVPDDVCAKLRLNQPATVAFDALDGRSFPARIAQINPSADLQSRQFAVRVVLDNTGGRFSPGMFARVTVVTEQAEQAPAVPREAVQQDREGSYVMTAGEDGIARRQAVVTGLNDADWVVIVAGVQPGQQVVTMSAMPLRDGQEVQVNSGQRRPGRERPAAEGGTAERGPRPGMQRGGSDGRDGSPQGGSRGSGEGGAESRAPRGGRSGE